MRAMQLSGYKPAEENPLDLIDTPVPSTGPGQVLVRVNMCGVCHTDLHISEGDIHPPKMPIIPGHQVRASSYWNRRESWRWCERTGCWNASWYSLASLYMWRVSILPIRDGESMP